MYNGMWDCIKTMHATEGLHSFYRSFPTTLAMNLPYGMVMVATNESLKKFIQPPDGPDGRRCEPYHVSTSLLAGCGAGGIAAAATAPLDRVKTRLQTHALLSCPRGVVAAAAAAVAGKATTTSTSTSTSTAAKSGGGAATAAAAAALQPLENGWLDALRGILREEGARGLFRGLTPRLATHAPAVAISWTTYESVKTMLKGWDHERGKP